MNKYFLILLLFSLKIVAQDIKFDANFRMKPDTYLSENLDKSFMNIYYAYNFKYDLDNPDKILKSNVVLQVGEMFSKYCDVQILKLDSMQLMNSKLESIDGNALSQMFKFFGKNKNQVFVDKKKQEFFVQNSLDKNKYEYSEVLPKISWTIGNETKEILGYKCKIAKANYRGRNYTAWFTDAIPIADGPLYFHGLPGLILEVEDSEKTISLNAIAIDKKPMEIYKRTDKNILQVSRKKFREIQKNLVENPNAFNTNTAYNEDGSPLKLQLKGRKYNPIELE
jgi:GLPGLI family protein